jgi:subtilisin family serine protease
MNNKSFIFGFLVTTIIGFSGFIAIYNYQRPVSQPGYVSGDRNTIATLNQINNSTNPKEYINYEPDASLIKLRESRIGQNIMTDFGQQAEIKRYKTFATANDPLANQWWETNLNTPNTIWDMPEPIKQTIVAVVDTGFALKHEDLQDRYYNNAGEKGSANEEANSDLNCTDQGNILDMSCNNVDDNVDGIVDNESGPTTYQNPSLYNCSDQSKPLDKSCNRLDDDNNGYIDDVKGWDFVNSDPNPQAGELRQADDVNTYHGTMVAGIVGASANNSKGIAGIDWNAKILPLQVLDDDGYGDSMTVSKAIKYATDQKADVINISLGTDAPDIIILEAIEYAYDKGVIVVASAGNDGCDCMVWPARYDITLSVGSYQENGTRSSFSSYGQALDIMAPGSNIKSTNYTSAYPTNTYASGSGTSFSAPVISGLISIIRANEPNITPLQLTALVTEMANKNINANQHKTTQHGYGTINPTNLKDRILNPKIFEQIYSFSNVTNGGVFYGNKNIASIYACPNNGAGTTNLYKSTKDKYFYSTNQTDLRLANKNGYTNALEANACILMPKDKTNTIREINLSTETSNQSIKSLL